MTVRESVLALDVGNSHTVMGLFRKGRISNHLRSETADRTIGDWKALLRAGGAERGCGSIVSSVVPRVDRNLCAAVKKLTGREPLQAGRYLDTGIQIGIPRPETLGADRLVNAAYGFHRFGGPLVLIDFGTATTLCAVSKRGEYLGGAILPGLGISLEALWRGTAKLPRIDLQKPASGKGHAAHAGGAFSGTGSVIGVTTESAMGIGVFEGHRGAVERICLRMKHELGRQTRVIATGGFARTIVKGLPFVERVEPDLTLRGLYFLYRRNVVC